MPRERMVLKLELQGDVEVSPQSTKGSAALHLAAHRNVNSFQDLRYAGVCTRDA